MTKKWKDICDNCNESKVDCHGYTRNDKILILCPECAQKLGFELWKKKPVEVQVKVIKKRRTKKMSNDVKEENVEKEENKENLNNSRMINVQGKTTRIVATSKTTVKINEHYYSINAEEERSIPTDVEVDMDLEWKDIFNSVNTQVDMQIKEIMETFNK